MTLSLRRNVYDQSMRHEVARFVCAIYRPFWLKVGIANVGYGSGTDHYPPFR